MKIKCWIEKGEKKKMNCLLVKGEKKNLGTKTEIWS